MCKYCYECRIRDIGVCFNCAIDKEICLNCIAYGENGYCLNCELKWEQDESIDLTGDFLKTREWIEQNNHYWKSKYVLAKLIFKNKFMKK